MQIKINISLTEAYTPDHRWCATFDSYDGAPDSGNRNRMGFGSDMADAVWDLVTNHIGDELDALGCGTPSSTEAEKLQA